MGKFLIITLLSVFISDIVAPKEKVAKKQFCDINAIFCQIVKNNPKIDLNYAYRLSNVINKVALEIGVNPKEYAAILAQESMYKLDAKNCWGNVCHDYGIAQINKKTIEAFKFDKKKLLTDLEYSVKAGAIVLADFKKMYGKKEVDFWTRYNASCPEKRQKYKQLVTRFL
jgi:soluble lytic murein transglycosylase-like protein